jgi:hypothetical protein
MVKRRRAFSQGRFPRLANGEIHRHPTEGEFDPLAPYIQADNVTQLKFRLKAGLLGQNGDSFVRVVHIINYFA